MLNTKNIAVMAGLGFVLSFLISILFAHTPFLWALFRGLVFAIAFGVLAIIIDFMYEKFLNDGEPADFSPDTSRAAGKPGARVDITIGEADLTEDGLGLRFAVNNNKHLLSEKDTRSVAENAVRINSISPASSPAASSGGSAAPHAAAPAAAAPEAPKAAPAAAEFKPMTLGKPLTEAPAAAASSPAASSGGSTAPHAAAPAAAAAPEAPKSAAPAQKSELDALPDLGVFDDGGGSSSAGGDVIEDTEFAETGGGDISPRISPLTDPDKATQHDTATLAKAIQTVLKRDE